MSKTIPASLSSKHSTLLDQDELAPLEGGLEEKFEVSGFSNKPEGGVVWCCHRSEEYPKRWFEHPECPQELIEKYQAEYDLEVRVISPGQAKQATAKENRCHILRIQTEEDLDYFEESFVGPKASTHRHALPTISWDKLKVEFAGIYLNPEVEGINKIWRGIDVPSACIWAIHCVRSIARIGSIIDGKLVATESKPVILSEFLQARHEKIKIHEQYAKITRKVGSTIKGKAFKRALLKCDPAGIAALIEHTKRFIIPFAGTQPPEALAAIYRDLIQLMGKYTPDTIKEVTRVQLLIGRVYYGDTLYVANLKTALEATLPKTQPQPAPSAP